MVKVSRLDWTIIFFLFISFCLSNFHSLFNGVYSHAPMYKVTNTSVSWFMLLLGFRLNLVWTGLFAVVLGMSKTRLNMKQALMIGVYYFSAYKDVYDWFKNNNQDTLFQDLIITVALWMAVQFLYDSVKRMFKN